MKVQRVPLKSCEISAAALLSSDVIQCGFNEQESECELSEGVNKMEDNEAVLRIKPSLLITTHSLYYCSMEVHVKV